MMDTPKELPPDTSGVRVLIVDDEAPARARLIRMLTRHQEMTIVGEADNGLRALEEIDRLNPDLVFLDIEMPELDGLAVASSLKTNRPLVVFVTAYNDRALKAFDVAAMDYLVKPLSEERLARSVDRVLKLHREKSEQHWRAPDAPWATASRIAVRVGGKFVILDLDRISAVLAKDHYAALIYDRREILSDDGLDRWVERLDATRFMRVHRGAIINLDFLKELPREGDRKYTAVLSDEVATRVAVARERLEALKARFKMPLR